MAANDLQVLVVVDIRDGVPEQALREALPHERYDRVVILFSRRGAPQWPATDVPHDYDWLAIGRAIETIAEEVHEIQRKNPEKNTVVYIGGKGPLSAFIHLGFKFGQSIHRVEVLNQARGSGPWARYPIEATSTEIDPPSLFDLPLGVPLEPSPSTGRLGIYVDTAGRKDDSTPFTTFLKEHEKDVGGIVRIRKEHGLDVTPLNSDVIMRNLKDIMSRVPSHWPDRRGMALFASCPVQVAVALGRAISTTAHGRDVWLTEWKAPNYEFVYSLPFEPSLEPVVPKTAEAINARAQVLDQVETAFKELCADLDEKHIPDYLLHESERADFVAQVKAMRFARRGIEEQPFRIRVAQDQGCLGSGILQAMLGMTPKQQQDFAKLVILHEIVHDWQELTSTNHTFIGRAGFVLEEVDYFADAFAVHTLVNMELAIDGRARRDVSGTVLRWIDMVQRGIEAFDRMEQGPRMKHLTERRLRRYLLWYLQHARAKLVKTEADAKEMLRSAVTIELAPLFGYIDSQRHEKVVKKPLENTELCIALDGRLVRVEKMPGYSVAGIVDLVREYKHEMANDVMFAVVDRNRKILARWLGRK
jgi:hypothetical protein